MKHLGWFKGRIYQSSPRAFYMEVQNNTSALLHLAWQQSVIFFRTLPGTFDIFIKKSAWQQNVICFRTLPGTFDIFIKKCLATKCNLLPHFARHFKYFHKKVPGNKM